MREAGRPAGGTAYVGSWHISEVPKGSDDVC